MPQHSAICAVAVALRRWSGLRRSTAASLMCLACVRYEYAPLPAPSFVAITFSFIARSTFGFILLWERLLRFSLLISSLRATAMSSAPVVATSTASTLVPPRLLSRTANSTDSLEVSLHTLPKQLLREFRHVFRDEYLNFSPDAGAMDESAVSATTGNMVLLALPTNQRAREDLVAVGEHIEAEKDRLLNVFMEFGADICQKIRTRGYWADYIDPCSGLPMLTLNCNKVYSEVDGMECLLNYRAYNAGFCKILTHPKWGSAVYPATIFAYCPEDVAREALGSYADAVLVPGDEGTSGGDGGGDVKMEE